LERDDVKEKCDAAFNPNDGVLYVLAIFHFMLGINVVGHVIVETKLVERTILILF